MSLTPLDRRLRDIADDVAAAEDQRFLALIADFIVREENPFEQIVRVNGETGYAYDGDGKYLLTLTPDGVKQWLESKTFTPEDFERLKQEMLIAPMIPSAVLMSAQDYMEFFVHQPTLLGLKGTTTA